jgi:CHASE1-domain containing sensor protein
MFAREKRSALCGSWRRQCGPASLVVLVGAAISATVFMAARSSERHSTQSDFVSLADDRFQAIDNVFEHFTKLVAFADNVFMVAPRADSPGFEDYVRSLKTYLGADRSRYPGLTAVTWAPRVRRDEVAAYERAAQAVFDPSFHIRWSAAAGLASAATPGDDLYPSFLDIGSRSDMGQPGENVAQNPSAWQAMTQARDTGRPIAMTPIKTSSDANDRFGYRVFQPIYRGGDPGTTERRRAALAGFLCLDLDVGTMVGKAFEDMQPIGIDVWAVDQTQTSDAVLCRHTSRLDSKGQAQGGRRNGNSLVTSSPLGLFGRNVTLYCVATPMFHSGHASWQPWAILCIGLALTLAGAVYRYNLAVRAAIVEQVVASRINSLRLEIEQQQSKRRQPKPLPTSMPGDTQHPPVYGAPVEMDQPGSMTEEPDVPMGL